MWKVLLDSAIGTSHERADGSCEDACASLEIPLPGNSNILILVCADGAGSARHAAVGAKLTCAALLKQIQDFFTQGKCFGEIDRDCILTWLYTVRDLLTDRASSDGGALADYACTVLLAILDNSSAIFVQVGDGAIVCSNHDSYRLVFTPERGEYLNTTTFVTSDRAAECVKFAYESERPCNIALLTDGLQSVALKFPEEMPHTPFFASLFDRVHSTESIEDLNRLLWQFLSSPAINAKTDDDKTLMLATQVN